MSESIHVDAEIVPIGDLKSYPKNPRRGDVDAIARSLEKNGQYKPIVASRKDKTILAGNHTWRAARSLGWTHIAVSWVDVDDKQAQKIVLADNRTSDMSSYDDNKLAELLTSLPDLEGTGFTQVDVDQLMAMLEGDGEFQAPNIERTGKVGDGVRIVVGTYRLIVDDDVYNEWGEAIMAAYGDDKQVLAELKRRLRLEDVSAIPPTPRKKKQKKDVDVSKTKMHSVIHSTETVDINSIFPYPMNARQGDIGMIAESLKENGQFRPVVVNRADNSILVGNHTWKAAKMLGWKEIAVNFIDVDDEAAARIVLADNKTADLGSYDHVELAEILQGMSEFDGTGYSGDDLDELMREVAGWGIKEKSTKEVEVDKPRNVTAIVGRWEIKMTPEDFDKWEEQMMNEYGFSFDEVCGGIIAMLGLQDDAWVSTRQRRSKRKSKRRSAEEDE